MSVRLRLLAALPFSKTELNLLISSAPVRYKEYKIPKRQPGKTRDIAQPTPEIKLIQRWIVKNELNKFPVHSAATAYKENIGLLANLTPHKNNRFLLKIDFKDFFPSITAAGFKEFMQGTNYSEQDLSDLCQLLFKNHKESKSLRLAIGAPSSPFISNILLYSLDTSLSNTCENLGITYTRYADDLSFSTNKSNILSKFNDSLYELIKLGTNLDLIINKDKTIQTSKKKGRKITGLTITEKNQISIGRDRKRLLRSQIFRFKENLLTDDEVEKLKGYMSFLISIEPEQIERLKKIYGEQIISKLHI